MRKLIDRPIYLKKILDHKDVDLVKIVTGIRRCGKSSLLDIFHNYLVEDGTLEKNIIHINLESLKYRDLNNYLSLYDYISERIENDKKTYLIFDELQNVEGWEKAIESFRLDFDVDIYITGSNAYLLSTEFSTLISGRYIEIPVLPLSFKEFLTFYEFKSNIDIGEKFQKYLQFGGMPILKSYNFNEVASNDSLEGIYSTVVLKDIVERTGISDYTTLNKVINFLSANIGSITSPNKIGNVLSSEGDLHKNTKIAGKTVSLYIDYLQNAYIFYYISRYDIRGKQLLKTLGKYYIIDIGFRNMLLGYRNVDRGHILENIVFLELIRRDYKVHIGKVGEYEVDFIAEKPNERLYIQVTESMNNAEVRDRELRSLNAIKDNYEKVVLSMDKSYISSYEGIKVLNVIDWLLDDIL